MPLPSGPKSDMARVSSPSLTPPRPSAEVDASPSNGTLVDDNSRGPSLDESSMNAIFTGSGRGTLSRSKSSRHDSGGAAEASYASPSCVFATIITIFARIAAIFARMATIPALSFPLDPSSMPKSTST